MIIAAIIVGIIIIGLIVLINYLSRTGDNAFDVYIFFGIWLIICIILEIGIINDITEEPHPKAIDVYQGRTTLKYTIRDGVKIDSVVVFKNSVYGKQN